MSSSFDGDVEINGAAFPAELALGMDAEFRRLMAAFQATMPLWEKSPLQGKRVAALILELSEGLLGEMNLLLCKAVEVALRAEVERIDEGLLRSLATSHHCNAGSSVAGYRLDELGKRHLVCSSPLSGWYFLPGCTVARWPTVAWSYPTSTRKRSVPLSDASLRMIKLSL